jgi:uncharacterized protein YjiS (DUF1127 family)
MSSSYEPVDKLLTPAGDLRRLASTLDHVRQPFPRHVSADPERVERGLAQLVLTVIELLRQLMERQALARMEQGTLTDEQIERMGETFMKLEERMQELKAHFGLEDSDLNLDLGPLGGCRQGGRRSLEPCRSTPTGAPKQPELREARPDRR